MKVEEAVVWLKRYQGYEPFENGTFLKHSFDLTDETVDAIISAISGANIGEPLTMEQLREMDGHPVLIKHIGEDSNNKKEWALVFCKEKICRTACGNIAIFAFYGIGWIAYAYPPAHIDREAWERCWTCRWVVSQPNRGSDYKFCPNCGRPLTPEAWAELEKRFRG